MPINQPSNQIKFTNVSVVRLKKGKADVKKDQPSNSKSAEPEKKKEKAPRKKAEDKTESKDDDDIF